MDLEEKKSMLKALRLSMCKKISNLSVNEIGLTIENHVKRDKFVSEVISFARSQAVYPIDDEKIGDAIGSIIGNMEKCAYDLHENLPADVMIDQLKNWDFQWRAQKSKNKRACNIDTQFLYSKKIRAEQARRSLPIEERPATMVGTPSGYLDNTLRNVECSFSIGIPYAAIHVVETVGRGSYGECDKVEIEGISFFPRGTFYAAKRYLGLREVRFKSFEKETSVDLMHNGIVRSIGHTRSVPWIAIFPFFNGGSIGSMLMSLAYEKGTYVKIMKKFEGDGRGIDRGVAPQLSEEKKSRISSFCKNAPSLIHAIVQSVLFAHSQGVVHCDLHPGNVMLDFTPNNQPRIGVIDWGLALRLNYEKRVSLTPNLKDTQLRPWLAPELLGTTNFDVYTKAVDVYALGWMISQICTFCEQFSSVHETDWESTTEASQIQHIALIVKADYYVYEKRKSLDELDKKLLRMRLEPTKCLRPMIEMMPAFY